MTFKGRIATASHSIWLAMNLIRISCGCSLLVCFITGSVNAQTANAWHKRCDVALSRAEFYSDAAIVMNRVGPSPSFVSEPRRGWGMHLDHTLIGRGALSFFATGAYERVPMGYRLDAKRVDHPGVPLPFDIQDLNITTSFDRVSLGFGAAIDRRLGAKLIGRVDIALMRHFVSVGQYYHQGVGAITDSTSTWVMGLDARVFQRSSTWHARMRLGAEYVVMPSHSIGLFAFADFPFGDTFSSGKVTLFGETQYRTTLDFSQRGTASGLCITYRYTWRDDSLARPRPK